MSGLVVFAPFFGGENLLLRARIGLVIFLSFVVMPLAGSTINHAIPLNWMDIALLAVKEFLVGAVLGYVGSLAFTGMQLAGELVGQQVGFTLANVMDPMTEQEIGIISFFAFTIGLAVFLALNFHLVFLKILALSYEVVGIGAASLTTSTISQMSYMVGQIWETCLSIGGPLLMVMLLVSIVIGFLTRTMPQLNIIVIGLPSRTLIGLLALSFGVRPMVLTMSVVFEQLMKDVEYLVGTLNAAPV
jgi:flagellar biosynthetic protein FliR